MMTRRHETAAADLIAQMAALTVLRKHRGEVEVMVKWDVCDRAPPYTLTSTLRHDGARSRVLTTTTNILQQHERILVKIT
jgi:hypothetical protein